VLLNLFHDAGIDFIPKPEKTTTTTKKRKLKINFLTNINAKILSKILAY
jgi:hypothetical protein